MQKDFHYYAIYVLARCAGFNRNDARVIAYSSQYADDSTESEPINVGDFVFDTVRTAHFGLTSYTWGVQKKVYIPFHFLPPIPLRHTQRKFSYVTKPNSLFAKRLLDEACQDESDLKLHRIGVALHTFADTWAHQKFSGRHDEENDVEAIHFWQNKRWEYPFIQDISFDLLPEIGHVQAGYYPDLPFQKWKYEDHKKRVVVRDNRKEFLESAKEIFDRLVVIPKAKGNPPVDWEAIKNRVEKLLSLGNRDHEKRCRNWKREFKEFFISPKDDYEKTAWRKEALKAKDISYYDWDALGPDRLKSLRFSPKRDFFDSNWVRFHRAAFLQRFFVLSNLM